ncbi:uncharacterized protein PHACADRAFT_260479 [Phanerochaete carnosa HHB-10118-sp]|uniref:Uncharacterized protein n=1 Tax=Phanerochaete carnosa (strain HHB-10118-sp) TaxID=650164 RepID=K5VZH8_PHACS|nr:uncharacterized protein PHACADRAFT_260479 [Phanerochaete carnosa HHB-10118-sp]EKM52240.1 hypothetical protein PHACADRAFT_260479 [Phanerochaete carnosa HHB-10118-sp]
MLRSQAPHLGTLVGCAFVKIGAFATVRLLTSAFPSAPRSMGLQYTPSRRASSPQGAYRFDIQVMYFIIPSAPSAFCFEVYGFQS